jgi:hypothetical protein
MRRIIVELEALSPIAHGDTQTGIDNATNVRLFMRSVTTIHGMAMPVPDISPNALRTVAFRIPLHDHLLDALQVERKSLGRATLNLLYAGGAMGAGAKAPGSEGAYGVRIRDLYPSLGLLGGSVDSFILPRSKMRLGAWPVAREFARAIDAVAPHLSEAARETSIYDLVGEETRTRGTGSEAEGNQMLYTYEVLAAGARLVCEMTLDKNADDRDVGAVMVALRQWDGYFGGQGRQGRGRMKVRDVTGAVGSMQPYLDHLAEHAEAMREGLIAGTLGTDRVQCAA